MQCRAYVTRLNALKAVAFPIPNLVDTDLKIILIECYEIINNFLIFSHICLNIVLI